MVRISNIEKSLDFYCNKLGMQEVNRREDQAGRYTLIFLAAPEDKAQASSTRAPLLELTYNWDPEAYG
jgi:lactoylglutathione lyase